jgi:hypothetical protein
MPVRFQPGVKPLCLILLVLAAALLLAACGGSSSTSSTSSSSAITSAVAQNTGVRSRVRPAARTRPDPVTSGVVTHRPLHGTGGGEINDDNPGNADAPAHDSDTDVRPAGAPRNPCTLVSSAQAQAILGTPVETPTEAPLGPTCIYRAAGAHSFVTVAVEAVDLATVSAHLRNRTQLAVGDRTAYCGTYGQPTVFVPLASGRVLAVTASCAVGAKFAATALPQLGA